jgi:hypothetical protein
MAPRPVRRHGAVVSAAKRSKRSSRFAGSAALRVIR